MLYSRNTIEIPSLFFYIWRVNWRWYIPILVIVLAFFGTGLGPSMHPNQEIVVRFESQSVNATEAQRAVSQITSQLKTIGATHVHASELYDGKLKVTYYSTIDVSVIKDLLDRQNDPHLGKVAFNT